MKETSGEAGPSNFNDAGNVDNLTSSQIPRIHFPNPSPNAHRQQKVNSNTAEESLRDANARRRVVSVDAGNLYGSLKGSRSGLSGSKRIPTVSMGASGSGRRVASLHSTDSKDSQQDSSSQDSGWGIGAFSDEYDLYPRILQDVQRALKLKYRREARRQSGQLDFPNPGAPGSPSGKRNLATDRPSSPLRSSILPTSISQQSTVATQSSSTRSAAAPPGSSATPSGPSASAALALTAPSTTDIDFSPSTRIPAIRADSQQRLHPIPLSNDAGETLDWSGFGQTSGYGSDDEKGDRNEKSEKSEKRWSLSVSRKGKEKEKEKVRELVPTADDLKRRQGIYIAKLTRIKTLSSQSTSKKVAITADQLGRRYNLIYNSLPSSAFGEREEPTTSSVFGNQGFNLLKVCKWYAGQETIVRSSLERAEPFIWLKHLEKRSVQQEQGNDSLDVEEGQDDAQDANTTPRLPWHLSALIMEEYVHAQNAKSRSYPPPPPPQDNSANRLMDSIPEHSSLPDMANDIVQQPDDGLSPPFTHSGYSTPSAYSAYSPPSVYSNYSSPSTYSTPSAIPTHSHSPPQPRSSPYSPYSFFNNSPASPPSSKRLSVEGQGRISFEPLLEPPLESPRRLQPPLTTRASTESRRSLESTFSSIFSSVGGGAGGGGNANSASTAVGGGGSISTAGAGTGGVVFSSPTSSTSRIHIRDSLGLRRKSRQGGNDNSDDGNVSSTRNSAAEQSDGGDKSRRGIDDSFVHVTEPEHDLFTAKPERGSSVPTTAVALSPTGTDQGLRGVQSPQSGGSGTSSANPLRNLNLRTLRSLRNPNRNSLPSREEDRIALALERKRKQEAEEAREDMEYELKAQLIASCKDSNTHIRSVLNRIAQHMREYEMCQASFISGERGTLPPELLEAFSHDPANVTSTTKRLKMYRAVDDIHHRLTRQRTVFREFLDRNKACNGDNCSSETQGGEEVRLITQDILKDPIEELMSTLKKLEEHRLSIVNREKQVSEMLRETQVIHAEVKKEYNSTLAHTSVVYPELSQIVALEESYKDQYQHLWDIGMDALTFILDSVTPFWRTYGKLIGDDVQDFLIIPLYRNEFTGESKRYPIPNLPHRSFRHWVGLCIFFLMTVGVMVLQARTAVGCLLNYRLLGWLEYGGLRWLRWGVIPVFWVAILVQWMAVIGEATVVVMQVGTVMWWVGWSIRILD